MQDRNSKLTYMKIKHVISLICVLTFIVLKANAQFIINGKLPVFDKTTNTYIISIPQESFEKDYETEIILNEDSGWNNIKINNETINKKYTFKNITANKNYLLSANTNNNKDVEAYITFTYLPIIEIQGVMGYDYTTGIMNLHNPNNTDIKDIYIKAKWRGGSTNSFDRNKRNYKIKTIDNSGNKKDYSFLDMRKDNNWILDAGQVDMFRMRNRIATELWNNFAAKPYYIEKEPNAKNGTTGKIVEVIINNEYRGIYSLSEAIDRKKLKLKKYDQDGTIHGQLWKTKGYGLATFWSKPYEYDNNKDIWDVFETKYPDIEDVCPTDYSTLWEAINFVSTSDDNTFTKEISKYFDIPVLIDYYIFLQLINGIDNIGKNMYWAIYDKTIDKKLTLAVWDLDATVGQNYICSPLHPNYVRYDNALNINGINIFYRLSQLNVDDFNNKLKERYFYLRQNKLKEDYIIQLYNSYYNLILNCGAAAREEKKWSYNSDIGGHELNFENEISYINDWIKNRFIFTDNFFSMLESNTTILQIEHNINNKYTYDIYGRNAYFIFLFLLN